MHGSKTSNQQLHDISRVGMVQAAETFSRLLRQPVEIAVVDTWMSDQEHPNCPSPGAGIGVYMAISGELTGGLLLFLTDSCAHWLTRRLLNCENVADLLVEPANSTLKEIGNIISSAFLASLDDQLGVRSLPAPPVLSRGTVAELFDSYRQDRSEPCLVIHTHLSSGKPESAELQGESYLFLSCQAMAQLLARTTPPQ